MNFDSKLIFYVMKSRRRFGGRVIQKSRQKVIQIPLTPFAIWGQFMTWAVKAFSCLHAMCNLSLLILFFWAPSGELEKEVRYLLNLACPLGRIKMPGLQDTHEKRCVFESELSQADVGRIINILSFLDENLTCCKHAIWIYGRKKEWEENRSC